MVLFILNPISGGVKSARLRKTVETVLKDTPGAEKVYSTYPGHAHQLAAEAAEKGYDTVVAVGGDGTVNEIASALVGTKTALGIVPVGSGNGLARHLELPSNPRKAISLIMRSRPVLIDSATVNGIPFFCTTGVGYDAQVAADYSNAGTRGLATYAEKALQDWKTYRPQVYTIESETETITTEALLITCGNANQWGNNYMITPEASLQDGLLDVAIVKSAPLKEDLRMVRQLIIGNIPTNPYVKYIKSPFVRITRKGGGPAHYDGEVTEFGETIEVKIVKDSLLVHCKAI